MPQQVDDRPGGSSYRVVYRFHWPARGTRAASGAHPYAPLLNINGILYGTTAYGGSNGCDLSGCGAVYTVSNGVQKILYVFGSNTSGIDGANPHAGLIDVNGTLYGTTVNGGAHGSGTVFSITTSGTEHVVYSFKGLAAHDGSNPMSELIDVNGTLYGTTPNGGSANGGTVFSVTTSGAEKVLHSFGNKNDGLNPDAGLANVGGVLYGTTFEGGKGLNGGTVFKITTAGKESVLYSFGEHASDGYWPFAPLVSVGGVLYGTTGGGGSQCGSLGCGTIFSVSTSGTEHVLYSFAGGSDGAVPKSAALLYSNGLLYGTTTEGGGTKCGHGCGTIFSAGLTGTETTLYRFDDTRDGLQPQASVIEASGKHAGALYGTTESGGVGCGRGGGLKASHCGVIFALSL